MDFKKTRLWQQDFICVCGRFKGEGSSFVCEGSGPIMAMQLERHLKASQTFLDGVKTLPNFREIQIKQHGELCRCLAKVESLTTEVSGRLLSLLDHALRGDYADQVKQDIVARTGSEDKERRVNQDYMAVVSYLPSALVARLESDRNRAQVLELLCQFLVKLGLRHPTEKTCGLILALAFDYHGVAFEADKWQYTMLHKATIQRLLTKSEPPVYLNVLPSDVAQCPRVLWDAALEGQQPHGVQFPSELVMRGRAWPLRASHRIAAQAAQPKAVGSQSMDFFLVGQMAAGMMSAGQPPARQSVTPAASCTAREKPQPLLALEDGRVEDTGASVAEPQVVAATAVPDAGANGVAKTLAALKGAVHSQNGENGKNHRVLKRPASKSEQSKKEKIESEQKTAGKVLKKPAAKAAQAMPSKAVAKRPAAAMAMKKSPKKKTGESKSQQHQRLLATLPPKLRRKFQNGCARCRWRKECCLSCWRLRGFFFY